MIDNELTDSVSLIGNLKKMRLCKIEVTPKSWTD